MSRFQVRLSGSRFQVIDTERNNRAVAYSGAPTNPPMYVDQKPKLKHYSWGNHTSAFGFASSLERANR